MNLQSGIRGLKADFRSSKPIKLKEAIVLKKAKIKSKKFPKQTFLMLEETLITRKTTVFKFVLSFLVVKIKRPQN